MISTSVPESDPIVKLLLSKGADVNEKSMHQGIHKSDHLLTCFQTTVAQYCSPLSPPDLKTNTSHQTALHFVSSKKNLDTARLLIENKASTRVRDRRGQYPIHRAAAVGSAPMVNLLLRNLSPLNPTDVEGFTPLHHAVAEGHGMSSHAFENTVNMNTDIQDRGCGRSAVEGGSRPYTQNERRRGSSGSCPRQRRKSIELFFIDLD